MDGFPRTTYHVYEVESRGWRTTETIAHASASLDTFLRQSVAFA